MLTPAPRRDLAAEYRDYLRQAGDRLDDWTEHVYNPWVYRCRRQPPDEWPPPPWPAPFPALEEFAADLGISFRDLQRLVAADARLREAIGERVARLQGARMLLGRDES